jgi:hypothetical protein
MTIRILGWLEAPLQAWRNGLGHTRELLAWTPTGHTAWQLRISVATIDSDGPFSAMPGVRRWFAVLDGAGVRLSWPDRERTISPGDAPLYFEGEPAPACRLLQGATHDLNLMTRGAAASMAPILPEVAHRSAHAQRGLFAVAAGTLCDEHGVRTALPAHTLLWDDAPSPQAAWIFEASATRATGPLGFWLDFLPDDERASAPRSQSAKP